MSDKNRIDRTIEYGIPQGTVLGPDLFSIINLLLTPRTVSSFVDNTVIICKGETWAEVERLAEIQFIGIKTWFDEMSLTINKTKYIVFSCNKSKISPYHILNSTEHYVVIEEADHVKYLGVEIDSVLKWNVPIKKLTKKLRSMIFR